MGKARKNCTIGKIFCLHHITGMAFITRLTLYVCIVEDTRDGGGRQMERKGQQQGPMEANYESSRTSQ